MAEKKENENVEKKAENGKKPEKAEKAEKVVDINTDGAVIEEAAPAQETPLEKAEKQLEEMKNSMMRTQADFENYKKRTKEISREMYLSGAGDAVTLIFPVIDSLEKALKQYQDDKERSGIELIHKQFLKALDTLGVKEIDALNKPFDPVFHDAVMKCEADPEGKNSGKVVEVFRTGYQLNEKVLRPSMVKIAN